MPRTGWLPPGICLALVVLVLLVTGTVGARAGLFGIRVIPADFSPNADGVQDRAHVSWILTDTASAIVVNIRLGGVNSTPVLRKINLGARLPGLDSTTWDGTDSAAVLLADGAYDILVDEITSPADTITAEVKAGVFLDNTPPALPVFDGKPDSAQTDSIRVLAGTALGADDVRVYREGLYDTTIPTTKDALGNETFTVTARLNLGANAFAVQGEDLAGNISPLTSQVIARYVNAPDLVSARATPVYFSPNQDGVADTTHLDVDLDAPSTRVVVDVRFGDPPNLGVDNSIPVAHLYDGPLPAGTTAIAWDGRDSTGALSPDGIYEFRVFAATYTGDGTPFNTPTLNTAIHLDTLPPGVPVLNPPLPPVSFRQVLLVAGASSGADSVFVNRNGTRVAEGGAKFDLQVPLTPDVNTFTLQAVDTAGNVSPVAGPFSVNFATPVGFHANERFRPNDAFVFNLERPATAIDVVLYTLRGRPVRTLASRSLNTHYDVEWDGKDDLGNFAGDGPYVARARILYLDGTSAEVHGAVVLVK